MPTENPLTWAYHDDFAELLVTKDYKVALRLLETADIALTFARALVGKEYERASSMLSTDLKLSYSPEALRENLEQMIQYTGDESGWPTAVCVVTGADVSDMGHWLNKLPEDFGWAYVSIDGDGYCEAVAVLVSVQRGRLAIREIVWGRP
jgi:hypothetical protein